MNKKDNIGMVALVVIGLVFVLAACGPGGGGNSSHSQRSVSSRTDSHQAAERGLQQKDEMIRRVNGIIENIGSAEARLQEKEETIREEKKALDEVKQNAKTAHLGGQMSDFRMWQRIGQEKTANIKQAVKKAENTISVARQGVDSELQRVNWVSSGDKEKHLSQINQRLSRLDTWTTALDRISSDLTQHETWLDSNE